MAQLHLSRACIDSSQLPSLSVARLGVQRKDRLDPRERETYQWGRWCHPPASAKLQKEYKTMHAIIAWLHERGMELCPEATWACKYFLDKQYHARLSQNLRSLTEGSIITSSTSAKLELDSLAPSFTGAGVGAGGGGVVIGAQKQLTVHRATANNSAAGILSIFLSLSVDDQL